MEEAAVGGARGHHRNDELAGRARRGEPDRGDESGPELPQGGHDRKNTVLGVRSAPAGKIEVGDLSRCDPSRVVEQRIQVWQPEAPADECGEEEVRGEPPGEPNHAPQSTERGSVCLLRTA